MLMLENGSSRDFEQVRVELHNDELIVRRDSSRKSTSRPLKNVCYTSHCHVLSGRHLRLFVRWPILDLFMKHACAFLNSNCIAIAFIIIALVYSMSFLRLLLN